MLFLKDYRMLFKSFLIYKNTVLNSFIFNYNLTLILIKNVFFKNDLKTSLIL